MRLLIVTQYFPPEVGAPQNRLFELAVRLQKLEMQVEVITAMPNYPQMVIHPQYKGKRYAEEMVDSIKTYRGWIYITKKRGVLHRLLNYFSFVFSSWWIGMFKLNGKYDFVLCESPPLFLGSSAKRIAKKRNAKFIFNVSDLWPESAEKLGIVTNKLFLGLAQQLEESLYKSAHLITGQTQGIVHNISKRFPQKRTYWLPNGVDLSYYNPNQVNSTWREEKGFKPDDIILFYGGILGHAQGLEVILNAAEKVQDCSNLKFVLQGSGPEEARLKDLKNQLALTNVFFLEGVNKKQMPNVVKGIDASIVPLKRMDLFKGAIPSKIFEVLSMKKPIILGVEGEAFDLFIKEGKTGWFFEPENEVALAKVCRQIHEQPELLTTFAENARNYVDQKFNRSKIAVAFNQELKSI